MKAGVLPPVDGDEVSSAAYINEVVPAWLASASVGTPAADLLAVTAAGAASLCAFAGHHLSAPLPGPSSVLHAASGGRRSPPRQRQQSSHRVPDDEKAVLRSLEANGEELIGNIDNADFLLLALRLLPGADGEGPGADGEGPGAGCGAGGWPGSASWWAARALGMQQRILAYRSAAVADRAVRAWRRAVAAVLSTPRVPVDDPAGGGFEAPKTRFGRSLAAAVLLEHALALFSSGRDPEARAQVSRASDAAGFDIELRGR